MPGPGCTQCGPDPRALPASHCWLKLHPPASAWYPRGDSGQACAGAGGAGLGCSRTRQGMRKCQSLAFHHGHKHWGAWFPREIGPQDGCFLVSLRLHFWRMGLGLPGNDGKASHGLGGGGVGAFLGAQRLLEARWACLDGVTALVAEMAGAPLTGLLPAPAQGKVAEPLTGS